MLHEGLGGLQSLREGPGDSERDEARDLLRDLVRERCRVAAMVLGRPFAHTSEGGGDETPLLLEQPSLQANHRFLDVQHAQPYGLRHEEDVLGHRGFEREAAKSGPPCFVQLLSRQCGERTASASAATISRRDQPACNPECRRPASFALRRRMVQVGGIMPVAASVSTPSFTAMYANPVFAYIGIVRAPDAPAASMHVGQLWLHQRPKGSSGARGQAMDVQRVRSGPRPRPERCNEHRPCRVRDDVSVRAWKHRLSSRGRITQVRERGRGCAFPRPRAQRGRT